MGSYSVTERRADLKFRTERADSEVSKLKKEKIKNRQVSGRYVTLNVFTGGSKGWDLTSLGLLLGDREANGAQIWHGEGRLSS
jgi:hypothetical protein